VVYIKYPHAYHLDLLPRLRDMLTAHDFHVSSFEYGVYQESQLQATLRVASIAVVIDDRENFGNAIQQIKIHDVPIFTVSRALQRGYFAETCGMFVACAHRLSTEQLAAHFERFLSQVRHGVYHPRRWVLQHLSAGALFPHIAAVLCHRRNQLFVAHETEQGVHSEDHCPF
jgi:hypothetical protein